MTEMDLLDQSEPEILTPEQLTIELLIPGLPDLSGKIEWERHKIPWKINSTLEDYIPGDMAVDRVIVEGRVIPREEHSQYFIHYGAQIIVVPKLGEVGVALAVIGIVLTVVSIALQFILAPQLPKIAPRPSGSSSDETSFSFGGFKTDLHAGVPIPVIYGIHKTGGVLISSFLKVKDADGVPTRDVFNMLLLVSHGPIEDITDIKINNQPVANFKDIIVDKRLGTSNQTVITGFEEVANTVETNFKIENTSVLYTTTVGRNCIALEVILRWLGGLMSTTTEGTLKSNSFTYKVEYRQTAIGGAYTDAGTRTVTRSTRSQVTNIFRIENLTPTRYDLRITKVGSATSEDPVRDVWEATLSGVTEITGTGRTYNNYALLGVRGVSTDQLTGSIPQITCVVKGRRLTQHLTVVAPPSPSATAALATTSGVIALGIRKYIITFITAGGETTGSIESNPVSILNNSGKIDLTNIPISSHPSVTGRKIYRNKGKVPSPTTAPSVFLVSETGGNISVGSWEYAITFLAGDGETSIGPVSGSVGVNGIITGTRTESVFVYGGGGEGSVFGSGTRTVPIFTGFARIGLGNIPISSRPEVTARRIYRRQTGGLFQLVGTINDNTTISFTDTIRDGGAAPPSANLSAEIPSYQLVGTINDNTTTIFTDNIADTALGAIVPSVNTASVAQHETIAWTDNPAWAVYDMLLHPLYGLGRWVTSDDVNLQSFIDAASYCDTVVNNGNSGTEKRAVIDALINIQKHSFDLLVEDMCGPHRMALLISNGKWSLLPDKITTPTQMFSMGNIVRDSFKLQYASNREQVNTLQVQFYDRSKDFEVETVTVVSQQQVEILQRPQKLKSQSLFGVSRLGQVVRESRYHLNNSHYIRRAIEFEADIDSILMEAGDVFWFQHSLPEFGTEGGRLVGATSTSVTLDRSVTLAPSTTYKVRVRSLDGSGVEVFQEKTVTNAPGTYTVLNVNTSFSTIPVAKDIYGFGVVTAATFRCLVIDDAKDMRRKISAIEYNDLVYSENPVAIPVSISTLPSPTSAPSHVMFLSVLEENVIQADGTVVTSALIQWNRGPLIAGTGLYGGVKIFYSDEALDAGSYRILNTVSGSDAQEYRWINSPANRNILVKVVAVNPYGVAASFDSAPTYNTAFNRSLLPPLQPSGLEVNDQNHDTSFRGKDAKFTWRIASTLPSKSEAFGAEEDTVSLNSLGIRDFVVRIRVDGEVVRTEYITTNQYTYTYEKNVEDNGLFYPAREFTFSVASRSRMGVLSDEIFLTVDNPVPDMSDISPLAIASFEAVIVDWSAYLPEIDYDLDHFRVYVDSFNPPTTERIRVAGNQFTTTITGLNALTQYFVKVEGVDSFGIGIATPVVQARTAGFIGYKLTLNQKVFAFSPSNDILIASMDVDQFDRELDWFVKNGADIHWGETTPNATVNTALGSKITSETKVRTCFDDSNNHQVAIIGSGWDVKYAKYDKDGASLVAKTVTFTPSGTDRFVNVSICSKGSVVHWILMRDVYSGAAFVSSKLQYARTDLSGSVQVSPTDITGTSGSSPNDEVRATVDSENNIHILFKKLSTSAFQANAFQANAFQINSGSPLSYVKVNNSGTVLVGVTTTLILPSPGSTDLSPAGMYVDSEDGVHIIGYTYTGIGTMLSYARITKIGELVIPATIFFSFPTTIRFAFACYDKMLNQVYAAVADSTGIYQIRLDPVGPTGLASQTVFPRASL